MNTLTPVSMQTIIDNLATLFNTRTASGHAEPIVVVSKPGQAKSDMVENDLRKKLATIVGGGPVEVLTDMPANRDAPDYRGFNLPVKRDGKAPASVYTVPDLIERIERSAAHADYTGGGNGHIILFLDELGQADALTQKALADLFLNYRLGEYVLSKNVWLIGAMNYQADGAGSNRILSHLINRVGVYAVMLPNDNWVRWARANDIPAAGIGYAQMFAGDFTDPKVNKDGPFLTYRSFTKAMNTIAAHKAAKGITDPRVTPDDAFIRRSVEGRIGVAHATQFFAFARVMDKLPSKADILKDPATAHVPAPFEMDVQYAACSMVVELCAAAGTTFDEINAYTEYALRLTPELATKALIDVKSSVNGGAVLNSPKVGAWLRDHRALLTDIYLM
jgi:hypothetical protein